MLQAVDSVNRTYVYSAYIDERTAPDVEPVWLPVVRIFAWLPRKESVVGNWRCVFWNEDFTEPVEATVVAWTDLNKFDSATE